MSSSIPTIDFIFDRKKQANLKTKGTVEMRITYMRKCKYLSTGIKCFPSQWDPSKEAVINSSDAIYCNQIFIELKRKAMKIIAMMAENDSIDINAIPKAIKNKGVNMSFTDYIYKRMKERNVLESTKKTYKSFFSRLLDFERINNFSDINEKSIRDFDEYLHAIRWKEKDRLGNEKECRYSQATIRHFHKKLKFFIDDAIIDGYVKENPYTSKRIKIERGNTKIDEYLTMDEMKQIQNAEMPTNSIREARDLFIFQCLTGLSYSDLIEFDFTNVSVDGKYKIYTSKRNKTGVEFMFVITPEAMDILDRYDYHLPHMPNQKYNIKLKIVADAAGLNKNLTTHMGRRTAGSVWLNQGVPIEVVSKCLGHRSIATTQKSYAKILDKTVIKAFEEHVIK